MARPSWNPLRAAGLRLKLVVFSALLTAATVSVAFLALSLELRDETKQLLADVLSRHEVLVANLRKRGLEELLRASALMGDNPTLRAAMETYRSEASNASSRPALLATIQLEAEKIAGALSRGLLLVTDADGRVLAASGRSPGSPAVGDDLSHNTVVRHALSQDAPIDADNLSVLRAGEAVFQVGCVPIVLQGFVIGTLMLGDPIDQAFVARLREPLDSDIVVTSGGRVLGGTLPGLAMGDPFRLAGPATADASGEVPVLRLGDEDYVAAPLLLGTDDRGEAVTLVLLRSLTRATAGPTRSLLGTLLAYGAIVVVVAGMSASVVSRSLLRPLEDFVAFLRAAGDSQDRARRFDAQGAGGEIGVLSDAFNRLMEVLGEHEQRLITNAREELRRLERLKESEKLAALGRMLSGAAHEINNPLTGVVVNIEMLLERQDVQGGVRERLEQIRREGQRIVALVRSLLKVAHRDGGQRAMVDVSQTIRDMVALRRRDFEKAGIRTALELPSGTLRLMAGELELQQVFLNIINNAYDALQGCPGRPTLGIRVSETPEEVCLTFQDNGPGLADPSRVFEHFYTTKPVGEGTGLGLSISRTMVENHGGRITADNPPEGGARFTIVLPRASAPQRDAPPPQPAMEPETSGSRRPLPASVLVVDDDSTILELQMAILDSLGSRAVGARSGAEAIAHLRKQEFDLVVTDLGLPGDVSGEDLYEWAAAHRISGTRGFLFVTGETVTDSGFLQRVKSRCVSKPFSMAEYVSALRETWDALKPAA